ncbi:Unknown protein [Striga hermonthica]|uniref:Arabidopsis retrotransposon Orf1 C-terminal domain-containing protein n=1 Tax=Striga hermonthica TaxID=68872 RepID=A0A9N7N800_STRHE|nr:Unknown protein [Striga hermonthica]
MENQHLSEEELSDWEQIQASENDTEVSVFPPRNHENLPTTNPQDIDQHLQQQQEPINSTDDDGVGRWKRLRLEMHNAILWISGKLGKYFTSKKVGLQTASGVACLAMVYLLHRRVLVWWQRRMPIGSRKERLMELIRQKDEKINQLLLQIAEMNEILHARRRVRVIWPTNVEPELLPQLEPEPHLEPEPREEPDPRVRPSELQGESHFLSEENSGLGQHTRFQGLANRKIVPSGFMDVGILRRIGMLEDVISLFDTQGWSKFMTECLPTYSDLTIEFLKSLLVKFNDSKAGGVIRFHLGGREYNWSLMQVDRALGFCHTHFWHSITVQNDPYHASSAKATFNSQPDTPLCTAEAKFKLLPDEPSGRSPRTKPGCYCGRGIVTAIAKKWCKPRHYAIINENPKVNEATLDRMGVLCREGTVYYFQGSLALTISTGYHAMASDNLKMLIHHHIG